MPIIKLHVAYICAENTSYVGEICSRIFLVVNMGFVFAYQTM